MQFSGYQRVGCMFAAGLFTVDCRNVTEGMCFYKEAALFNWHSLFSMT
jgi:hypothetical protein